MQQFVSAIRWALGFLIFFVAGLAILPFLPSERLRFPAAAIFCRLLLWALGGKVIKENDFPDDRRYIIMANHTSLADPLVFASILPGKFTGLIAESQTHYPLWGSLVRLFKVIPIKRRDPKAAREAIKIAEQRLADGYHVVILPEGTRTLTGKMGPLKKGGFHMAINTGSPILPVGMEGGFAFKSKLSWILRPGPLRVHIGKPIEPEVYNNLSMEAVMAEVRQRLLSLSGEQADHSENSLK